MNSSTNSNKHFITFGCAQFQRAVDRITQEARALGVFDTITGIHQKDLTNDLEFWAKNGRFIAENPRGFGYFIWKPYILLQKLQACQENEIVVYADAGCTLNPQGLPRLNEYFDIVQKSEYGLIGFELEEAWCSENRFTKMDLIDFLNVPHLIDTRQIMATVVIVRKCEHVMNLIRRWYSLACLHHFLDDSPSLIPNTDKFEEHRHDQSIFSLLCKSMGATLLADEPDSCGELVPIQCTRRREITIPCVSILGSCRQTSVAQYFSMTDLHEELTYPHYSKEIIQAIEHASGVIRIHDLDTLHCFRKGILNKSEVDYNKVRKIFDETDIFLVEIASRKKYVYDGKYVHHILTEEKYGFYDRMEISIEHQSDAEIEDDLIRMKELLYPKPFIIVSHLYSVKEGSRYELIQLLKNLCAKLKIPFLNPSERLQHENPEQLYEKEAKLAHWTPYGHSLIAKIYKEMIERVLYLSRLPSIVQVYYTDEERVAKQTIHGLGDYIRGCCYLLNYCRRMNLNFKVSFSHHTLSKFLYNTHAITQKEAREIEYFFCDDKTFHERILCLEYPKQIFTNNMFDLTCLSTEEKQEILRLCLTPRIQFQEHIQQKKQKLGIEDGKYKVIHVRLGDNGLVRKYAESDVYLKSFQTIMKAMGEEEKWIVMTDSQCFENILQSNGCLVSRTRKTHVGHYDHTVQDVEDTLLDFFLMSTAHEIHQFSVYSWGSGFSGTVSALYNIPLVKHSL